MKRLSLISVVLILFILHFPAVSAAEQVFKPNSSTGGSETTSPSNAYDKEGYDESTSATTTNPRKGIVITYNTWENSNKKSYTDLNLSVTVETSGFNNDNWFIYYDRTADNTCDTSDSVLKTSGSQKVNLRNYTVSLPVSQQLSNLQVCVGGNKSGKPDTPRSINIYDIRTEGRYDGEPPSWRNQEQSSGLLRKGEKVNLSAQGRDNFELSHAILSTNETGTWRNKSTYGSPKSLMTSEKWTWSNFTWQNSSLGSSTVSWKIWYNDTSGNYNVTDVKSFVIDAEKPNLTIFSPQNKTYSTSKVDLNVSASESISQWKYNLDSAGNVTFTPNTSLNSLSEGSHTVKVWAKDSAGNWNSTSRSFSIDTRPPNFSDFKEDPSSPAVFRDRKYQFNVTVSDRNLETVKFEFGGINYSTSKSGDEYYRELENISAGNYTYKWYANDTLGNLNSTKETDFEVRRADTNTSLYLNGTRGFQSYRYNSTANLTVGLNVSETVELWTNFSGSLQERKTGEPLLEDLVELDYQLGSYKIKGVFSGNQNYTSDNETHLLKVEDRTDPKYSSVSDDEAGKIYRNETIQLRTLWDDNYGMSSAILSVNSTGSFENVSSKEISDWANFSYSFPEDSFPGILAWRQYGNDTSGNYNRTGDKTQEVWSYARSKANLNTTSVQVGEAVKASCRVQDALNKDKVSGYQVKLLNGTVEVASGNTGSKGWFNTTFSLSESQDNVPVTCAIGDNDSLRYTALENGSVDLTVNQGNPPKIYDGVYSLNDTELFIGDSFKIYARWNSSLNYSYVEYDNQSKNSYQKKFKESPFQNNYTNFTISTGESWFKGRHSAQIYANDSAGNLNNSLDRLEFDLKGYSNVSFTSPKNEGERGVIKLVAKVLDSNTSEGVSGYNVSFWSSGSRLGYNETNSSGEAVYMWNTSAQEVGEKNVSVRINDSNFYSAVKDRENGTFDLIGLLRPSISEPDGILHREVNETFSAEVYDDQGDTVDVNAEWSNSSGDVILNSKSGEWKVPENYTLGEETFTLNVTKNLYRQNSTNVTVEVYGYSNILESKFSDSKIKEGQSSAYLCRVGAQSNKNAIQNYPVDFYNGTEKIGRTLTNSTGWARKSFTDETAGNETYRCEIGDNSTLFYNASSPVSIEKDLETVDTTSPNYTVDHPSKGSETQKKSTLWVNSTWQDNLNLSKAIISFNDSGSFVNRSKDISGVSDEADFRFTNTSFEGVLGYRIYGNDTYDNFNSTQVREITVYGGSSLYELNTTSKKASPGETVNVTCGVRDNLTSEKLNGYQVEFYNGTDLVDTGSTGDSGKVEFNYSQGFTGDVDLNCKISDSLSSYYKADKRERSVTVSYELGSSESNLSQVTAQGGKILGSNSDLDKVDGKYLNWTNIGNSTATRNKILKLNTTTNIPPSTVKSVEFDWSILRKVENTPGSVNDPGGDGTLTLSNGDINSTWSYDTEYAEFSEAKSGNAQNLARKGFYINMPENETESSFSKIRISAEVKAFNNNGEGIDADVYNYNTGSYLDCFEYSANSYGNVSCTFEGSGSISELLNGNQLSLEFRDTLSQKNEVQSSWRVDGVRVEAYYSNPNQGNTFEYRTGFYNQSSGALEEARRVNITGQRENFSSKIDSKGGNIVSESGDIQAYLTTYINRSSSLSSLREQEISLDKHSATLKYEVSRTKDFEMSVKNASAATISGTKFEVFESGKEIDSESLGSDNFSDKFAEGKEYKLRQSMPDESFDYNVTYSNFSLKESGSVDSRLVKYSELEEAENVDNVSKIYAVDSSEFNFDTATLKVPKKSGTPDVILHCTDFDFQADQCNDWEVNKTSAYPHRETSDYFIFNVTGFDAFGTGNGETLPNLTNIEVFDVTGLSAENEKTGGEKEDSGLNKTFLLEQSDEKRVYRFQFTVENQGSVDWNLNGSDELFHKGLNSTWNIDRIWYNISGSEYNGGNFSGEKLKWNTSRGGNLTPGQEMYAKYTVNISTSKTRNYSELFKVNDTSLGTGSRDNHDLKIRKYGYLDLELTEPPQSTTVRQNDKFVVNATVNCVAGDCGKVNISPRYNQSSVPDTLIPESSGSPFYTKNSNIVQCSSALNDSGSCYHSWDVNATGELDTEHLVDVNGSSNLQEVQSNDSKDSKVRIDKTIILNVTWDKIDFGTLKTGEDNQSAEGNSNELYNITVTEDSLSVDELWVRAENLTAPGWGPSSGEGYSIPASKLFYDFSNTLETKSALSNSYEKMDSNIDPGTTKTTYYWMNVPTGLKTSTYTGNMYFKANSTS